MEPKSLVPAAQYVRMSTEDQQYSIINQSAAIQAYAKSHGYVIVATYADAGKSGVEIKHRKGLRRLLSDVMSGRAQYKSILVYDVSRWGRFQDVDEAAHYEFLCKSAGVPVRYCVEQFDNDGSLPSSIMKAMKRTMAAEYSRELGVKVLNGQRRLALLGYRVVGTAGYGLRRMMVSPDGHRRIILKDGEHKAIHTDRTILVPGPKKEVDCIRAMFGFAALGKSLKDIAKELNVHQMFTSNGLAWRRSFIYRILKNEKYAGCNTYGKTTQRLSSVSRVVDQDLWVRKPEAFIPIIDQRTFDRVQKQLKIRGSPPEKSDACLIQTMKKILARDGQLTHRILKKRGALGCAYYRRFGSIMKAYEIAGYLPASRTVKLSNAQNRIRALRKDLYIELKRLFSNRVRIITLPGQHVRQIIEIEGRVRLAVYLCHAADPSHFKKAAWVLRFRPLDQHLPALICTIDQSFSKFLDFYVLPAAVHSMKAKIVREGEAWLSRGRKLDKLEHLCDVANEVAGQSTNCEGCTAVDDILIAADTPTITLGEREISLGPVGSAIFNTLALNAGQAIPRDRLLRSVPQQMDSSDLDAHIWTLRAKLGAENRKRIQTVRGVGYMYVSPEGMRDSEVASRFREF